MLCPSGPGARQTAGRLGRLVRRASRAGRWARRIYQQIPLALVREWLLIEWPEGEAEPTNIGFRRYRRPSSFVGRRDVPGCDLRIERDFIAGAGSRRSGLGSMRGADGAASIICHACIATYGSKVAERADDSPLRASFHREASRDAGGPPEDHRPRGLRLRPDRPHSNSIATVRARLLHALSESEMRDDVGQCSIPGFRSAQSGLRSLLNPPYELQESETGLPRHGTQGLIQFAIFATAQRLPVYT